MIDRFDYKLLTISKVDLDLMGRVARDAMVTGTEVKSAGGLG